MFLCAAGFLSIFSERRNQKVKRYRPLFPCYLKVELSDEAFHKQQRCKAE